MAGIGIYIVASVGCVFAKTQETLIALRFVRALGGSAGPVIARATVRDRFEPQEAARVLSYLGLVFGMAPILGPIAGAALLLSADWRGSFFMLAILAGLIGVISYFFLDEVQPLTPRSQQRETLGAAFLAPMKDANFIRYTFVLSLGGAMMLTYVSQSPGLFIEGFGFDPQPFALIFALNAAGFIAVGQINARTLRRAYFEIVLRRGLYAAVFFAALVFFFAFTSIGGHVDWRRLGYWDFTVPHNFKPWLCFRQCDRGRLVDAGRARGHGVILDGRHFHDHGGVGHGCGRRAA